MTHVRKGQQSLLARIHAGRLFLGVALAIFFGFFTFTPLANRIETQYGLATMFALRGSTDPPPGVIVVAIDTETIDWLRDIGLGQVTTPPSLAKCLPPSATRELAGLRGPGDLPRAVHACLLDSLRALAVPAVVFDILFSVPSTLEGDAMFAQALRAHGATAILAGLQRSTTEAAGAALLVDREVQPIAPLKESAAAIGTFPVTRGSGPVYGYWRHLPGFAETKSLIDEALLIFRPTRREALNSDRDTFRYLWYYGAPGSVPSVSMRAVLASEVSDRVRKLAADSAFFIGASDPKSTNYPDSFPTYFQSRYGAEISGVELAATAFLNLLETPRLHRLSSVGEASLIAIFVLGLGLFALARGRFAVLLIAGLAILYLFSTVEIFSRSRLFLPVITPVFVAAPLLLVTAVLSKYTLARTLIARLVPAPIARGLLTHSGDPRGVPVAEDATVVFCDIIGSTAIAESLSEVQFSNLLNTFFDMMTREIEKHHGFVTAFTGDGFLAVFRKSEAGIDHPVHACRAMIAAIAEMQRANSDSRENGLPPLGVRIGINSGVVAEGELGARDRFNFSVVGDVVNLAARLEQLGKTLFPGEENIILIGSAVQERIRESDLITIECGLLQIPGRKRSEGVFRLAA